MGPRAGGRFKTPMGLNAAMLLHGTLPRLPYMRVCLCVCVCACVCVCWSNWGHVAICSSVLWITIKRWGMDRCNGSWSVESEETFIEWKVVLLMAVIRGRSNDLLSSMSLSLSLSLSLLLNVSLGWSWSMGFFFVRWFPTSSVAAAGQMAKIFTALLCVIALIRTIVRRARLLLRFL